jgi:hypothetical protein
VKFLNLVRRNKHFFDIALAHTALASNQQFFAAATLPKTTFFRTATFRERTLAQHFLRAKDSALALTLFDYSQRTCCSLFGLFTPLPMLRN